MARKIVGCVTLFAFFSIFVGACGVTVPYNGQPSCSSNVYVEGYIPESEGDVTFQAYDWIGEDWEDVGSTSATDEGTEFCPEGDMYKYEGYAIMGAGKYWQYDEGAYWRRLRVEWADGYLYTFDDDGIDCMTYLVEIMHADCDDAAEICKCDISPFVEVMCPSK